MGAASGFWTFVVRLHTFAGPVAMLLYPLYSSVKAIESPSAEDDQQWLTYWVLYSLLALIELGLENVLVWIPIWPTAKLAFIIWLVLPQFKGAAYVYQHYVREHVVKSHIGEQLIGNNQQKYLSMLRKDTKDAVAKYISRNGADAFDKLMAKANRDAEKTRSSFHE